MSEEKKIGGEHNPENRRLTAREPNFKKNKKKNIKRPTKIILNLPLSGTRQIYLGRTNHQNSTMPKILQTSRIEIKGKYTTKNSKEIPTWVEAKDNIDDKWGLPMKETS